MPPPNYSLAEEAVTLQMLAPTARAAWVPSGAIGQSFDRNEPSANQAVLSTGRLQMVAITLPAWRKVTTFTFLSGTTAGATLTNQWVALYDAVTRVLIGTSADKTTEAWAANTPKTFTLSTPYTPTADVQLYVALNVTATTVPSLIALDLGNTVLPALPPILNGTSSAGQTTPALATTPAAALTTSQFKPYCYWS